MKGEVGVPTDLSTDMSEELTTDKNEEVVIASLPNSRYQRAIDRFIGEKAINIKKFTQIDFKLESASCFYNTKRHDLLGDLDKGYIAFHDSKNLRCDIFSFILQYC